MCYNKIMKKKLIETVLMVFIAIIALSSGCVSAESPTNEIVMQDHVVVVVSDMAKYDLSWPDGVAQNFVVLKQEKGLPLLLHNNVQHEINFVSIRNSLCS